MANLLTRMLRRQPEISRFSTSDYLRALIQNQYGLLAPLYPSGVSYAKGKPAERIENSFTGYVYGGYKANPIVFGVMKRRSSVFSEARFMWRDVEDGRPGDLFYTDDLALLVKPWPNGTTGELLTRMIQDVDLAGNFYAVNEGDRLRRLRPDWVQIILSGDPRVDVEVDVMGYWYAPGGSDNGAGEAYLPDQVCHWSPLPDPDAMYRGMSWLTPVVREIQGDQAAVDHKLAFFRNGATLGPIVKVSDKLSVTQFKEFIAASEAAHQGVENAYKTMYLGGGADVTLAAADFRQMDFTAAQGKAETRICVASGVPAVIAGVSEGLAGSSLNAGNYNAAKRSFVDGELRTLWRSACAALSTILVVPDDAELWFDETCIAYLREDQQDAATIAQLQMSTIVSAITGGFEPDAAVVTVNPAWKDSLKHSGLVSVQLNPPGQDAPPSDSSMDGGGQGYDNADLPPVPPGFEPDATRAWLDLAVEVLRTRQSDNSASGGRGSESTGRQDETKHPHAASGPGGGQFVSTNHAAKSSSKRKTKVRAKPKSGPSGVPQPPPQPRTMRVGDSGEDVRYAQYAMSLLGFHVPQDGTYDQATADAVKQMQARLGMKKPNGHLSASQLHKLQDAVRLSPCIGRSESARAEEWFEEIVRSFDAVDGDEDDDDAARAFNPEQPRVVGGEHGGQWTSGLISDALRLAGKIDLDSGEELTSTAKVSTDYGTVRMASTDLHGRPALRIGIGDGVFGSRDDEAGPWLGGGPDELAKLNAEPKRLRDEQAALEAEDAQLHVRRDPLVAKYVASQDGGTPISAEDDAELDRLTERWSQIDARLAELDDADTNEVVPSGYSTRLDAVQVGHLRSVLADANARGAVAVENQGAAYDALPDGTTDLPPSVLVAEGSIPGEWGDVHYRAQVDDPETGLQYDLAVVQSGMTFQDVLDEESAAAFDAADVDKLVKQLDKMVHGDGMARALVDAIEMISRGWVPDIARAGHSVAGELRDARGTSTGGQFRSIASRIAEALDGWIKGEGPDDPLAGYSQPQLKTAATQLGLNPPKGMKLIPLKALVLQHATAVSREAREALAARRASAKFSIDHGGRRIDVAVFTDRPGGTAPSLREVDDLGHPGRVITSQPDLAGLERWATTNGHTDVAAWARKEGAGRSHQTDTGGSIGEAEAWRRMHGDKPMPKKRATPAAKPDAKTPTKRAPAKKATKAVEKATPAGASPTTASLVEAGQSVKYLDEKSLSENGVDPRFEAAARAAFDGKHGDLTATIDPHVSKVYRATREDGVVIQAEGYIRDPDGRVVGSFRRMLYPESGTVHNDTLAIAAAHQRKGFATSFNAQADKALVGEGFTSVSVSPSATGGVAWADFGWDHSKVAPQGDVPYRINELIADRSTSPADRAKLQGWVDRFHSDPSKWPSPREIADLGDLGTAVLKGASWKGIRPLQAPEKGPGLGAGASLEGRTSAQLRAIAKAEGIPLPKTGRTAELAQNIADFRYRRDSPDGISYFKQELGKGELTTPSDVGTAAPKSRRATGGKSVSKLREEAKADGIPLPKSGTAAELEQAIADFKFHRDTTEGSAHLQFRDPATGLSWAANKAPDASVAPVAPTKAAKKAAPKPVDLGAGAPTQGRTVAELRQIAAAEGIPLPKSAPKAKLAQAIADHRAAHPG